MSDTVIRVENLSKRYLIGAKEELPQTRGEAIRNIISAPFRYLQSQVKKPQPEEIFWALKDVSFEIKAGEVIGVIGRNGAGKSTLLKILSRITKPTSGFAEIKGRVGSLLEVGTGFHPELTGRENIYLNGTILGMSRREVDRKFDEIVDFAEVEKFLDTPVKRYSSGMYVRLAFAVAAHLETEILVVDEVLAVGDAAFQKKCLGKMGDVAAKEGRTVLFVSHNMTAVSSLCSECLYLKTGVFKNIGKAGTIVNEYLLDISFLSYIELDNLRLSGYSQDIKFISIAINSDIPQDKNIIIFGNNLHFTTTIYSSIFIDNLNIGISIYSADGTCLGTLFTKEKFALASQETITLEIIVHDIGMVPGLYYAAFGIGLDKPNRSRHDFDVIVGYPYFQVVAINNNNEYLKNWPTNWGYISLANYTYSVKNTIYN